ncbi:MAG: hypothetical protein ACLQCB_18085 [Spirochaetia bacterium]
MKRRFVSVLVVVALLFVAAGVFAADSPAFKNGGIEFQAGIGFGFWGYYTGASMTVPPIIASVEYQFMAAPQIPLSVGLLAGYTGSQYKYDDGFGDTYTDTFSFIVVGGRVSYHFIELIKVPNLDTYAGLLLGYDIASVSYSGTGGFAGGSIPGVTAGGFTYGFYAGARYYFASFIGIYAELGYTLGYVNAGLALKI